MHDTAALPVPRLADHIDTENGPSDEEGEKEAKRQRSEPTTPISTSSRLPYECDEVMGITQVDPREAERFEEGLDLEYHDASENPSVSETSGSMHKSVFSHGGCGSSSLRECVELLNNTEHNAPATLHSGVKKEKTSDPQRKRAGVATSAKLRSPDLYLVTTPKNLGKGSVRESRAGQTQPVG